MTSTNNLKQTILHTPHVESNARIVDFNGWAMPVNYGSQINEHHAVRNTVGMFDIAHMSVIDIHGSEATKFLSLLLANDVGSMNNNHSRASAASKAIYSCMLNQNGGIIDDLIVYSLNENVFRLVTNAGNHDKNHAWLQKQAEPYSVSIKERKDLSIIAIQGPDTATTLLNAGIDILELRRFHSQQFDNYFVARTGYTGEDGVEIILDHTRAQQFWQTLTTNGVQLCGLGARDTLRLEAGLALYGSDLSEEVTPLESGLTWTIKIDDDREFIGKEALLRQRQTNSHDVLIGLVLDSRGILRHGQQVYIDNTVVGEITSGTFSPTLKKSIALARIKNQFKKSSEFHVDVRNKQLPCRRVSYPFIKNGKSTLEPHSIVPPLSAAKNKRNKIAFADRHIGPDEKSVAHMLKKLGYKSLDELSEAALPSQIFDDSPLALQQASSEIEALAELKEIAQENQLKKSLIGQGYHNTITPNVIKRNVLENPAWYTAYTPYQPEISQGRLEVLFYFQTMITELTGLDIANASLLDEATAAAEAMLLAYRATRSKKHIFAVSSLCHPQTIALLKTRSGPLDIELIYFNESDATQTNKLPFDSIFGIIFQYPTTDGRVIDNSSIIQQAKESNALVIFSADLLALTLLKTPAELGADIAIGTTQRFGVPLGFGGPHAAYIATLDLHKRNLPGRLVGLSVDIHGNPAYRLALQTREQHIRRDKATSNICTAQSLPAILSALYACYHGPDGLLIISENIHQQCIALANGLSNIGYSILSPHFFDTITVVSNDKTDALLTSAAINGFNLRRLNESNLSISLDETSTEQDIEELLNIFKQHKPSTPTTNSSLYLDSNFKRDSLFMQQDVFNAHHSETQMMRYLKRLANKDIALDRSMIALGSCTMKLNSASQMQPISWPELADIHPFAPSEQTVGYQKLITQLEDMLCACTGYAAVSLQPNAGSQGEYAGLLAIKRYHESLGDTDRNICLIPSSAHGTNPASAKMANMKVVIVKCDDTGNIDIDDLKQHITQHSNKVAAIMITYPSTHGVFEENVVEVCGLIHKAGGQVYIDGANLNALVGLAKPGEFGGDVSHLNLHKTFGIPHGGGGPGVGPVIVKEHLIPFLPKDSHNQERQGAQISASPFGSGSILAISWMYIRMMGASGLKRATQVAILSANYIAHELKSTYPILFTGKNNLVAHECIIDIRPFKNSGVTVDDVAKRLIDFGFHAPTMSFPIPDTLMIEPTESESLMEIERFCHALKNIHAEYGKIANGDWPRENNPLSNAPHSLASILQSDTLPYPLKTALMPDEKAESADKYWPPVSRIKNAFGDRNLICSCPSTSDY